MIKKQMIYATGMLFALLRIKQYEDLYDLLEQLETQLLKGYYSKALTTNDNLRNEMLTSGKYNGEEKELIYAATCLIDGNLNFLLNT